MLKILNGFFVVMGVIFSILILGAVAILLLTGMNPVSTFKAVTGNNATKVDNVDKNPLLTEEQEAAIWFLRQGNYVLTYMPTLGLMREDDSEEEDGRQVEDVLKDPEKEEKKEF